MVAPNNGPFPLTRAQVAAIMAPYNNLIRLVQSQLDQWDLDWSEHEIELPADTDLTDIDVDGYGTWKLPGVDNRAVFKQAFPHPTNPALIRALFERK